MFKVGDIIKGKPSSDSKYCVTNSSMLKAKVLRVMEDGDMKIKMLEHKDPDYKGVEYSVENSDKYFELIKSANDETLQDLLTYGLGRAVYTSEKIANSLVKVDGIVPDKEEKKMVRYEDVVEIYFKKQREEIEKGRIQMEKEKYDEDAINQFIKNEEENIKEAFGLENVELRCSARATKETLEQIEKIREGCNDAIAELKEKEKEILAVLRMTETYEQAVEILVNYEILDKKTKKLKI